MTKKLLHVVVFLLTTFSLHSQAPGYFGKTFFASVGSEIDIMKTVDNNVYGYGNAGLTPGINLEFGKMITAKRSVSLMASYATFKYNHSEIMRNYSNSGVDLVHVDYTMPSLTLAVVMQSYGKRGPAAPMGVYSKLGLVYANYSAKVDGISTSNTYIMSLAESGELTYQVPDNSGVLYIRTGFGYNVPISRSAMVSIESILDFSASPHSAYISLPFDASMNLVLKASFVYFIF